MSQGSKFFNEALLSGRYRGQRTGGLIDRLDDTDLTADRRRRLSEAEIRFEAAVKAGDEIGREIADAQIDAVLDEGREAHRQAAAQAAAPEPVVTSFDGGVQQRVRPRSAYLQARAETPAALFRRALQASAESGSTRGSLL